MSHFDKFVQTFKVAYTYRSQISTNDANINILLSHPDDITLNLLKYLVISSATSTFVGEKLVEFFLHMYSNISSSWANDMHIFANIVDVINIMKSDLHDITHKLLSPKFYCYFVVFPKIQHFCHTQYYLSKHFK